MKIAITLLSKNEENRIVKLVYQLQGADVERIYLFDDNSQDKTIKNFTKSMEIVNKIRYSVVNLPDISTFAGKRNYADRQVFSEGFDYNLHIDIDEIFDQFFLKNLKTILSSGEKALSYTFPRINLPNAENYPDYQTRLLYKSQDIEWRGEVHERPYSKKFDKPLTDVEELSEEFFLYNRLFKKFKIIHSIRRADLRRPWW